jgi:hypothetical protein
VSDKYCHCDDSKCIIRLKNKESERIRNLEKDEPSVIKCPNCCEWFPAYTVHNCDSLKLSNQGDGTK